jgi:hypothetical protein
VVTANDIWSRLKLYFDRIDPPTEALMRDILSKLRSRGLLRIQRQEDGARFGDTQIEILPTLTRVIPFENESAWEQQRSLYSPPVGAEPAVDDDIENSLSPS